jgi:hypothetical protein
MSAGDVLIAVHHSNQQASNPTPSGCVTWPAPVYTDWSVTNGIGRLTIWVAHVTAAATGCSVTFSPTTGSNAFAFQVYRGVLSVGTPVIRDQSTAATLNTNTINAGNAGNFILGLFVSITPNLSPFTAVGNTVFRRSAGSATLASAVAIADIPSTSAGQSLAVQLTPSVSANYRSAAVELTGAPANVSARITDAMQTIVMNATHSMNYVLPQNGLSSTWCTWFMPIGSSSNVYELEPTTTQVNGQANHIRIPSWQMTRVCQDQQGNFWASPPLLAGAGISLTPAPTGVTISSSAGDMSYIDGGIANIPGTVAVAAGTCQNLATTSSSAVGVNDVVSWTLQSAAGTGWSVRFYPLVDVGSIAWRGCNDGTSSTTPGARSVNWYVARHVVTPVAAKPKVATHHKVVRPKK